MKGAGRRLARRDRVGEEEAGRGGGAGCEWRSCLICVHFDRGSQGEDKNKGGGR